jgi:selenide,water dikinase
VAVTGIIETDKIIRNIGARVGDSLYLTKPLGTGIISTAIKHGAASPEAIVAVTAMMKQLNKAAADLMVKHDAHAATDITGYGLLGHAYEMASGSGVSFVFKSGSLPLLPDVLRYAEAGHLTGGASSNREYLADKVELSPTLTEALAHVLFDAQTSGGLLIAVSPDFGERLMKEAQSRGTAIWMIGEVVKQGTVAITVI